MATTKIWKIGDRMDHVIEYAANKDKTSKVIPDLYQAIDYATNENKTEKQYYVTGVNCVPQIAYQEMIRVKKQFQKLDRNLGYHAYQSFKGNEATPEIAHEIGVKLAEEIWGDRFQVLVTTHVNTNNVHNHFVINSVSFVDGKKYYNKNDTYALIRRVSDDICREYGLSTIEEKEHYKNFNKKYERNDFYTNAVREDIDFAIGQAYSYKDFERILEKMGYILTYRNEVLSLRKEPYKRNIRIERTFGEEYSFDMIKTRILNTTATRIPFPEAHSLIGRYKSKSTIRTKKKTKGLRALYWYYCYLLKIYPKNKSTPKLSKAMQEDVKKMDAISNEIRFLGRTGIQTLDEFTKYKDNSVIELNKLKGTRENLWKKYNRTPDEDKREFISSEIQKLAIEIEKTGVDIKMCKNISKRSLKIKESITEINTHKEKEITEKKRNKYVR